MHWCRIVMNKATWQMVTDWPNLSEMDALEISGERYRNVPFRSYESVSYPEFDICHQVTGRQYDYILSDQVWEHLKFPYTAAQNALKMLRPGGLFYISVPFSIRYHPHPIDCTRWSTEGLKYFLMEVGFPEDGIRVEAWGNKDCVLENYTSWVDFDPDRHSLENDPLMPMHVWGIARKSM